MGNLPKTPLSRITAIYFGPALKNYATRMYIKIMYLDRDAQYGRAIPAIAPVSAPQLWINTVVQGESQAGSGIPGDGSQRGEVAHSPTSLLRDYVDNESAQI